MSERTATYQASVRRYEQAFATLHRITDAITTVGDPLRDQPERLRFAQIPGALAMPISTDRTFDGMAWPPAQDIHNALAECHSAIGELRVAWINVPIDERSGLKEPPDHPWATVRQRRQTRF